MKVVKKLKLKPSARDNRRYFVVNCSNKDEVEKAIINYIGILGLAKSAFLFVDKRGEKVIYSCLRESLNLVLASLAFARLKVLKVSGTLNGLYSFY